MLLRDVDTTRLQIYTPANQWGKGTDRERLIYRDDRYWYKIWGENYLKETPYSSAGCFKKFSHQPVYPHGFEIDFFTPEISTAFKEFIYDNTGVVRGYITLAGNQPKVIHKNFISAVFASCIKTGWIYSDFCWNNIIEINGNLSLIDFDTHFTKISTFVPEFEKDYGALRGHVIDEYRNLILCAVNRSR